MVFGISFYIILRETKYRLLNDWGFKIWILLKN